MTEWEPRTIEISGRTYYYYDAKPEWYQAELEKQVWVPSEGKMKSSPPKAEPSNLLMNLIKRV